MKKTSKIVLFLMAIIALTSCQKDNEMSGKDPVVTDYEITVSETHARISWKVDYIGQFQTGVEVSTHEDMSNAKRVEAKKEEGKYIAVVDGLTASTQYYYRIVVWNKFINYKEEKRDFKTQGKTTYQIKASCSPTAAGSVTGAGTFEEGKYCTLEAFCNDGYRFEKWTENGNQVSTSVNYTFKVTKNRTLVAQFVSEYSISVSASPSSGGTVSGGGNYTNGQSCTVSATASSGYTFSKWTENGTQVSTNANYTFTVNSNRTLVAHFTELQADEFNINVSANPLNGGTVTGDGSYHQGEQCTVTVSANIGYDFTNWTENGSVVSTNASYSFTVNGNRTLVANFTAKDYTIGVSANPASGGSVTGGGNYHYGDECTISATANEGYTFTNWTKHGSVVSNQASYTFIVTDSRELVANFQEQNQYYNIRLSAEPAEAGTVQGAGSYAAGTEVTVIAIPVQRYDFLNWIENGYVVSTESHYTFTVDRDRTLVAHFGTAPQVITIYATADPEEGGTVTGGGEYIYGDEVTVTASPNIGFVFVNWTEEGEVVSEEANYFFVVTENRHLVANFTYNSVGGHGYVDLGLPSGLLWATCNIGANSPEDYGQYFAWGETNTKEYYEWDTYSHCNGTDHTLTKYCSNANYGYNGYTDDLISLLPEDESAETNWGENWRMPSLDDWIELIENTTNSWVNQNGINGRLFISSNGRSLFLPAAGFRDGPNLYGLGGSSSYWSSSLTTYSPNNAGAFKFSSDDYYVIGYNHRNYGLPIRPVYPAQ